MTVAKKTTAKKTRSRAETAAAFEEIRHLETDNDPKAAAAAAERAAMIRGVVAGKTPAVVKELVDVKLSLNSQIDGVAQAYLTRLEELSQLNEAIELAKDELKNYHNLDVAQTTLDQLVADYDEKKASFDAAFAEMQAERQRRESEQEDGWRRKQAERQQGWDREREQYEYQKAQERQKAEDGFLRMMELKRRELADEETNFRNSMALREKEILGKEQEITELRATVAGIDERVKKEVERATAIVGNSMKKDHTHELALVEARNNAQNALITSELKAAQQRVNELVQQNAALQAQLVESRKQVENIAVQSVQSAAGSKAFEAVNRIAETQAQGVGQKK